MTDEQPEPTPTVVLADNVVVLPKPPKKDWAIGQRPAGLAFYATLFAVVIGREIHALATGQTTWTVSAILWWASGPGYEPRWWIVCVGLVAPFLAWLAVHVAFPEFAGRELLWCLGVGLVLAFVGIGWTELTR